MAIPNTHCSRCFCTDPKQSHEHKQSVTYGNVKFSKAITIPLCDECYNRVTETKMLSRVIMAGGAIVGGIIGFLLYTFNILSGDPLVMPAFFGFIGVIIGLIVGEFVLPARRNTDVVTVKFNPYSRNVQLFFKNEQYQTLYKSRNPLG